MDVSGNISVYVKQDSLSAIKVEADENLMEYIEISVDGNTLYIKPRRGTNLRSSGGIKVYVSNPSYANFEASGACDIYGENKITSDAAIGIELAGASSVEMELRSPAVDADLSGASDVTLKGETKKIHAHGSGASSIKCFELMTEEADISLSGASHAKVFASVKLQADASGASGVEYKGNPSVSKETRGASSIKKVE